MPSSWNLLTRVVVPTGRPPRLLIEIGIAKCANPSLRGRSEQIGFKRFCGISVDAGDSLRIDNDRHHDPLEQRVAHDQRFQIDLPLPLEPQKRRKTKERVRASPRSRL